MRETFYEQKIIPAIAPAVYSASMTGPTIDILGFDSLTFAVSIGVGGITFTDTNRLEVWCEHSDDGTTWSAPLGPNQYVSIDTETGTFVPTPPKYVDAQAYVVLDKMIYYPGIVHPVTFVALNTAHATPDTTKLGYVAEKRFVRLGLNFAGTHSTGTPVSAVAALSHPLSKGGRP